MKNYQKMYYQLFIKVSDAIDLLVSAQQEVERQYIEDERKPRLIVLDHARGEEEE